MISRYYYNLFCRVSKLILFLIVNKSYYSDVCSTSPILSDSIISYSHHFQVILTFSMPVSSYSGVFLSYSDVFLKITFLIVNKEAADGLNIVGTAVSDILPRLQLVDPPQVTFALQL